MTEGPTSATSMWTSEPRQTQKRGQGGFPIRTLRGIPAWREAIAGFFDAFSTLPICTAGVTENTVQNPKDCNGVV